LSTKGILFLAHRINSTGNPGERKARVASTRKGRGGNIDNLAVARLLATLSPGLTFRLDWLCYALTDRCRSRHRFFRTLRGAALLTGDIQGQRHRPGRRGGQRIASSSSCRMLGLPGKTLPGS